MLDVEQTLLARRILHLRLVGFALLALLVGAIVFVERQQVTYFRLYTFCLAFLFLAVATALVPARVRALLLVLSSLAFGFSVIEGIAVAEEPPAGPPATVNTAGKEIRVPGIGWDNGVAGVYHGHSFNYDTRRVIFDVDYTIDQNHDRLTRSTDAGRSVVFWGDSLSFGQGINDADTLPQRFADLLDSQQKTLNLGVDGYGPTQVLYQLQTGSKDDAIGKDPLVFVMQTGAFHAVRTSCREDWMAKAPYYVERAGTLVYAGDCFSGLGLAAHQFLEDTASYRIFIKPRLPRETREDVKLYIDIVAEIVRVAKEKYGVETLVPYIGGPVDTPRSLHDKQVDIVPDLGADLTGTGFTDASVIAALRARGVNVVDMTLRDEAMSGNVIAIPDNNHPTPFANQRRAHMVLAQLKAMGIGLSGLKPERLSLDP